MLPAVLKQYHLLFSLFVSQKSSVSVFYGFYMQYSGVSHVKTKHLWMLVLKVCVHLENEITVIREHFFQLMNFKATMQLNTFEPLYFSDEISITVEK